MADETNGDCGVETIELSLFADWPDLENFGSQAVSAFHACLEITEISGRRLHSTGQAVMLARLIIRMLTYKAEQARLAARAGVDVVDRDIDAVWPTFEAFIDAEITDAAEVLEKLKEAAKETAN